MLKSYSAHQIVSGGMLGHQNRGLNVQLRGFMMQSIIICQPSYISLFIVVATLFILVTLF